MVFISALIRRQDYVLIRTIFRLHLIINIHKITAGPFQENGYIVHGEENKNCFLIDPGDNPELYIKTIETNGLTPLAIINTHGHIDHIHAVQPIKDHYSIPFYIQDNEKMIVDHYPNGCLMYGMIPNKIPEVDHWFTNETEIEIGEYKIDIIRTPGHTPGGNCYLLNGDIFTGDTLFRGSIGRTDFPGGNYQTLMNSLQKLINEIPPGTRVHSGHGYSTTIKEEISSNPFLVDLK